MMKHVWTVLCSRSIRDAESNNVTLVNVLEQITIKDFLKADGLADINFEIVTLWSRLDINIPIEGTARIIFMEPSGKTRVMTEYPVNLEKYLRSRNRIVARGLPVCEPGIHYFRIEQKVGENEWIEQASIPLQVIFVKPEDKISDDPALRHEAEIG